MHLAQFDQDVITRVKSPQFAENFIVNLSEAEHVITEVFAQAENDWNYGRSRAETSDEAIDVFLATIIARGYYLRRMQYFAWGIIKHYLEEAIKNPNRNDDVDAAQDFAAALKIVQDTFSFAQKDWVFETDREITRGEAFDAFSAAIEVRMKHKDGITYSAWSAVIIVLADTALSTANYK